LRDASVGKRQKQSKGNERSHSVGFVFAWRARVGQGVRRGWHEQGCNR
jgi:hypothetical protein